MQEEQKNKVIFLSFQQKDTAIATECAEYIVYVYGYPYLQALLQHRKWFFLYEYSSLSQICLWFRREKLKLSRFLVYSTCVVCVLGKYFCQVEFSFLLRNFSNWLPTLQLSTGAGCCSLVCINSELVACI